MTSEEAIKVLRTESIELGGNAVSVCQFLEALDMAISALRHEPKVVEIDQFKPLTLDELRNSAGSWVWVVVNYEHCKCDGWALVPTPAYVAFLDQTIPTDFYGKKFVAYRQKPEEDDKHEP